MGTVVLLGAAWAQVPTLAPGATNGSTAVASVSIQLPSRLY